MAYRQDLAIELLKTLRNGKTQDDVKSTVLEKMEQGQFLEAKAPI